MAAALSALDIHLFTCCEKEVMSALPLFSGVSASSCVPNDLLVQLYGPGISLAKDRGQRTSRGCRCGVSVDIGDYRLHPCGHACLFCYANPDSSAVCPWKNRCMSPESNIAAPGDLSIRGVNLENPLVLAPLAGITNLPFRLLAKTWNCGLVCSEMISANGLVHGSTKTLKMLDSDPAEKPLSVQIFGSDPAMMADAAQVWRNRARIFWTSISDVRFEKW